MLGSLLLNIPKFLEARLVMVPMFDTVNNITVDTVAYNVTELRLDPDYMYYYIHWTRLLFTGIIPFIFLSLMNILIYNRMQQNNLSSVRSKSATTKKAGSLAAVLIVIVLVFLVSNTPRLILNLFEFGVHGKSSENDNNTDSQPDTGCSCDLSPVWYSVMISVSHFFLTINSSINFLIYCSVGEKFKTIVLRFCKNLLSKKDAEKANKPSNKEERETETTELDRKVDEELLDSGNNIELINVT